jgi:LytTr DNA-binding domain
MHEPTPALRERRPPAAHASRTAAFLAGFARVLAVAAAAGVFLAFVGAFGTGSAPIGRRLAYWLATMVLTTLAGTAIFAPAYLSGWVETRPILKTSILALVVSLPVTVLVWALGPLFFPEQLSWDPKALLGYFPPVVLVAAVMTAIVHMVIDRMMVRSAITHAAFPGAAPARFLERLPLKLRGGELYAVEAEDHYLRLHTSKGSDLILMRLSDAVAELEGLEGAQTHRSWWVAKAAVTEARRGDGRAVLTLKNGVEAPVSRGFAGALREAGWF